jgi:hypothetical protein
MTPECRCPHVDAFACAVHKRLTVVTCGCACHRHNVDQSELFPTDPARRPSLDARHRTAHRITRAIFLEGPRGDGAQDAFDRDLHRHLSRDEDFE